jgi:glycosyltransferase involved in cell wall biosynthesis
MPELTILIPAHNESGNLDALMARLVPAVAPHVRDFEILFVDDGSRDDTFAKLRALAARDARVRAISFSRNFGKEIAIAAGLDEARGDAVVMIDADLQMPPEVIPEFLAKWREGYATVYGERIDRHSDGPIRRVVSEAFYRLFAGVAETKLTPRAGDFRLMDRKVVDALRRLPERARFTKGLYAWVGFSQIAVPYDHVDRHAGRSQWGWRKLFGFAFDGLTAFSTAPLRLATWSGVTIALIAIAAALFFTVRTLIFGRDVPGFPALIVSVMFFSGIQLVFLGVIGEYVGRIFNEVKNRPLYIVADRVGDAPQERAP